MRALTAVPGTPDSLAIVNIDAPTPAEHELLVDGLEIGICGTDHEIASGAYGWPPSGSDRLIIGHESLGRVRQAPPGSAFAVGDLIAGVVRRPDPVPCGACAQGQFDMCRNGEYTERGIKSRDGYAAEQWVVDEHYAVKLDPALGNTGVLMEPTTVVTKAWDEVYAVGGRAWFEPRSVLITGAGPIGLLAAMIGVQRGLDVHVLDLATSGIKPTLVADLGATYHANAIDEVMAKVHPDIVVEATGVSSLVLGAMNGVGPYGIVCLTGVSSGGHKIDIDAGQLNRELVLDNVVVIGSVNANLRHYAEAADILARADQQWLARLITRRVPLSTFADGFDHRDGDVKVVLDLTEAAS